MLIEWDGAKLRFGADGYLREADGTAKGGIVFAIARQLQLPIRYIGVGEQAEDLRSFDAETFVDALFED